MISFSCSSSTSQPLIQEPAIDGHNWMAVQEAKCVMWFLGRVQKVRHTADDFLRIDIHPSINGPSIHICATCGFIHDNGFLFSAPDPPLKVCEIQASSTPPPIRIPSSPDAPFSAPWKMMEMGSSAKKTTVHRASDPSLNNRQRSLVWGLDAMTVKLPRGVWRCGEDDGEWGAKKRRSEGEGRWRVI